MYILDNINLSGMPKKSQVNKFGQDARASEAEASSASIACLTSTMTTAAGNQNAIMEELQSMRQELLKKMDEKAIEIQTELRNVTDKLNKRLDKLESHTSELENGVTANANSIATMESDLSGMKKELSLLRARCEDLEARSRRCNVRITGVKEGREQGKHPSVYVAGVLKEALGLDKLPTLDRVHRTLRTKPVQDDLPPRAFVVKCHYFTEKELLLKKAAEAGVITTADGDTIRVLPDFTQAVSKQRAAFTEVRKLLRSCAGVRYGLRYPATLRITTADGQETTFKDPKRAKEFVLKELLSAEASH